MVTKYRDEFKVSYLADRCMYMHVYQDIVYIPLIVGHGIKLTLAIAMHGIVISDSACSHACAHARPTIPLPAVSGSCKGPGTILAPSSYKGGASSNGVELSCLPDVIIAINYIAF